MNSGEPYEVVDDPKMKSEPEIDDLEELKRELGLEFEGKDSQKYVTNAEFEPAEKSKYPPGTKAAGPKVAKSGEFSLKVAQQQTKTSDNRTVIVKPLKPHNEENLRLHRNINAGVKLLVCKICKYRTWKKLNMKTHKRTHAAGSQQSNVGSSNANKWIKTFTGERNLNHNVNPSRPSSVIPKEKSFKCDECDFEASHKWDLLEHKTTHSREVPRESDGSDLNWEPETFPSENTIAKPFLCDVCDYRSSLMGDLMKHKKLHTDDMPFVCVTCNAKFNRKCHLVNHRRVHVEEKPFKCKYCNSGFKLKITLKRHEVIHEKFLCDFCDYRTGLPSNLRAHKALHMGQTPSIDDTCNSAFTRPRMAHNRPTYRCEECPYKTGRKNELTFHMVKHTGEKPFRCAECGYRSLYEQNLKKHEKKRRMDGFCTKRERQIRNCEKCEYSTANKQDFIMHMVTHTGEKPFKCKDCEYGTVYEFNLRLHRQKKHPGTSMSDIFNQNGLDTDRQKKAEAQMDGSKEPAMHKEMDQIAEMNLIENGMDSTVCNEMNQMTELIPSLEPGEHTKTSESTKMEVAGCEVLVGTNQADHGSYGRTFKPIESALKDAEPNSAPTHDATLVDSVDSDGFHETSRFKRIMRRLDTTSLLWIGARRRTEAKPFACNQCDYRSKWEFNLWKHLETHKEDKPYKCDGCDFRTGSLKGLKAHMKIRGHGSYEHERGIQDSLARRSAELDGNTECTDACYDENQLYKSVHDVITAREKMNQTTHSPKTEHLPNPLPDQPNSPLADHCGPAHCEIEPKMTPTEDEADQMTLQAHTENDQMVESVYDEIDRSSKAAHKEAYQATEPAQTEKKLATSGPPPKQCFKWDECDFECDRSSMLSGHMRVHKPSITRASALAPVKHRSGTKRFGCPMCKYRSQKSHNVIIHMRTHTGERPYQCRICSSRFAQQTSLKKHMRIHSEKRETPYKCLNCDFKTSHMISLKAHRRTWHYGCGLPNGLQNFTESVDDIDQHTKPCNAPAYVQLEHNIWRRHDQVAQVQGESGQLVEPDDKAPGSSKKLLVKPIDGDINQSVAVQQHYRTSDSLQHEMVEAVHTSQHPKNKAGCKNAQSMNNPEVVHSEDARVHRKNSERKKPFACDECNYHTWNKNHITIHLRVHSPERPFKCYTCDYQSACKGHMRRHQIVHTGEKRFSCDKCDFRTGYLGTLKAHMQRPDHKNLLPYRWQKRQQSHLKCNSVPEHPVAGEGPIESPYKKNQLITPVDGISDQSNDEQGVSEETTKAPAHVKTGNHDFVDSDEDIEVESCGTDVSGDSESTRNDQLITPTVDEDGQLANPEVDEIAQLTKRFREEVDQLIGSIHGQLEHSSRPPEVKHDRSNEPTEIMTAQGPRRPKEEKSYAEHSNELYRVDPCGSPSRIIYPVEDEIDIDTKPALGEMLDYSFGKEISQGVSEVSVKPDPESSTQFIKSTREESDQLTNSNHDKVVPIKLESKVDGASSAEENSSTAEMDHVEYDQVVCPPFSEKPIGSENRQYVLSNTGGKPFKCDICDYRSDGRFLLEVHKKSHRRTTMKPRPKGNATTGGSGIKPFACDQCDYRSKWRGNLTKHMMVHTGERPFECNVCGFRTSHQQSLSNHRRTHIGESRSHSHWKYSINRRITPGASKSIAPDEDVASALRKNATSGSVDDEMELDIKPVREELDQFIKPMHDEMDQFVRVVPDSTDPAMKPDDDKDLSAVITDEAITPAYETSVYPTCPVCLKSERKMFKFRCEKCRYFWNSILKKGLGPPDCPGHSSESEGLDCPGCRWGRYLIAAKEWERTQSVAARGT